MKNIIWSLILVFFPVSVCKAQKVFSVEYENQADVKVYVVEYENQADLKVYKVKYENQAGQNNGKWFLRNILIKLKRKFTLSSMKTNPT